MKALLCNEIYWSGFALCIGLPFGGHLLAGLGFSLGAFVASAFIYTLLFPVVMHSMRAY